MIRYPGSKDKIARAIVAQFPPSFCDPLFQRGKLEYREPFFGAGAVGFRLLELLPRTARAWLNDRDYGMVCLWNAVKGDPDALIDKIDRFHPVVDDFYRLKEQDAALNPGDTADIAEIGFRKFVLHRISFSGLGAKAGGPIGGRKQSSEYPVDCRWNATQHRADVRRLHRLLRAFPNLSITCRDFQELIDGAPAHAFIYADPPYYEKGPELYKFSLSDDDHRRLAQSLQACRSKWVLSYDDHPFIRSLYGWAEIQGVHLKYTTAIARESRRKNSEIIIKPPRITAEVAA